jgi:hypothetical protein
VNLEVLNGYVLAVVGLFAVFLYIAMVAGGCAELISRLPKAGTRKQRSQNLKTTRKRRNVKKSPHS